MLIHHIRDAIGNTPLLKIDPSVHCIDNLELYCKLEYMNPFGSLKDRPASYFIEDMKGQPEKTRLIESSSGNTIKAIGCIANTHGFQSMTITNRIKVQEQLDMLRILGVDVQQLPTRSECIDFSEKNNAVEIIEKRCAEDNSRYHTDQYRNQRNTQSHIDTTAQEILEDLGEVDYFFSGLGTTGSSSGIGETLRQNNPDLISVGIVSDEHDFIPGIRTHQELTDVGIFMRSRYNVINEVTAIDAVEKTIELVRKTGMLCGPTTGAVYHAILSYFSHTVPKRTTKVVFLGCDRIENYFSYIKERVPSLFHHHHKECILRITHADEEKYYQSIDAKSLYHDLDRYLLIDTRSTKAYQLGYIEGSINIPFATLNELVDTGKVFASNKKIVLLCMQGRKTRRMCAFLNKLGYTALNLEGGLQHWRGLGFHFFNFQE